MEEQLSRVLVGGMTCSACTSAVTQAVQGLPGVTSVEVNLATECAAVRHSAAVTAAQIMEAIEDCGFDASLEPSYDSVTLQISGMTCSACSAAIDQCLERLDGVDGSVNLTTETAQIRFDQHRIGIRTIVEAIEDCGFDAVPSTQATSSQMDAISRAKQTHEYRQNTFVCAMFGIPLILLSKLQSFHVVQLPKIHNLPVDAILCFLMVLPIQWYVGRKIYRKAFKAWRSGVPNMDVLVTVSVGLAFTFSVFSMIYGIMGGTPHMFMWDACAMILLFVSFGKWLENKARGETSKALSTLLSLVPEKSTILENGEQRELPTDMLQLDDTIIVQPGAKIPVDGVVVEGSTYVSEAILTGEFKAIPKLVGSPVFSGTTNGAQAVKVLVTMCGTQTKLGQIVALIKEAQASKAPIQRFADYAAGKFVYGILGLASSTFLFWAAFSSVSTHLPHAFNHAPHLIMAMQLGISVVVVACPCALGLATPTAVMVASGVGARHGVLVKGGAVFEALSGISVVLFDKTGTLTEGNMSVEHTDVSDADWPAVYAVAQMSEHPVAHALAKYAGMQHHEKARDVVNVVAVPGRGVCAEVDGREVLIGSATFLAERGVDTPARHETSTCCYIAVDNAYRGIVTLSDNLRSHAAETVEALRVRGLRVGLISGDNAATTHAIAAQCGIEEHNVWSGQNPADKIKVVQDLQVLGHRVCMIGDGVNDSPALAAADVGISLEGATQVAVDSADVVLLQRNPLVGVVQALDLCKATLRRIKMNLLFSVMYNALLVPVAMGALLWANIMMNPINASASMAISSVTVVCSSLLLKRWRPRFPEDGRRARWQWTRPWGRLFEHEYIPLSVV